MQAHACGQPAPCSRSRPGPSPHLTRPTPWPHPGPNAGSSPAQTLAPARPKRWPQPSPNADPPRDVDPGRPRPLRSHTVFGAAGLDHALACARLHRPNRLESSSWGCWLAQGTAPGLRFNPKPHSLSIFEACGWLLAQAAPPRAGASILSLLPAHTPGLWLVVGARCSSCGRPAHKARGSRAAQLHARPPAHSHARPANHYALRLLAAFRNRTKRQRALAQQHPRGWLRPPCRWQPWSSPLNLNP
jgi:hypothetical protein